MLIQGLRGALALLVSVLAAPAQTLSVVPTSPALNPAGGTVVFSVRATFADRATIAFDVTLPAGWSYVSGTGEPGRRPDPGARGALHWEETVSRAAPYEFSFTAAYPAGSTRASVGPTLLLAQPAGTTQITLGPIAFGPPGAPTITVQPASVSTVISSGTAVFSVVAAGTPPLAYQWRKDGAGIPGATAATFGYGQAATAQSGRYDVVISNALGTVTSDLATLTVLNVDPNPGQAPPLIDVHPLATTAPAGGAASFSVLAISNYALEFQWLKNGTPITGASGAVLVLPEVQATDVAAYSVIVRNAYGFIASRAATLSVGPPPTAGTAPALVSAPINQVVPQGTIARLSAAATGSGPLAYQWLHYGVPIAGATTATLDVPTTTPSAAGTYRVVVSNPIGAVASPDATVSFAAGGIGLSGTGSMPTIRTIAGGSASFAAPAVGSPPFSYQWYKDDFPLPGATATSLEFPQVIPSDAGRYRVDISNPWGSARYFGQLTVEPAPVAPTFVFHPLMTTLPTIDSPARISATVDGTAPFSFQWLKNGQPLSGATAANLEFRALQASDAGSYTLVVANAAGTATSSAYPLAIRSPEFSTLGIGPTGGPVIMVQPRALTIREGAAASFSITATATISPLSYQWRRDGVALPGATAPTLEIPRASAAQAGHYTVVTWNPRGVAVSEAAHLTVSGRTRAGTYLGNLSSPNGAFAPIPFALYVRDDYSAVYLGGRADPLERATAIDEAGHFQFGRGATSGSIAGANAAYTIEGNVTADGRMTGTYYHPLSGARGEMSASRRPDEGPTQAFAGLFRAGAVNAAAVGTCLIDAAGSAITVMYAPGASDFSFGAIDAEGRISAATSFNRMSGSVRRSDGTLSLDFAPVDGRPPFALIGAREGRSDPERLVNISTRAAAGPAGADPVTAGFYLAGTEPKSVLIRAIGPTLNQFGVTGVLSAPRLELFRGATAIASNNGWDPNTVSVAGLLSAAAQRVGAFALPRGSKDAVLLTTLEPGAYTARVSGEGLSAGITLVEIYDATEAAPTPERRMINLATRARTGPGDQTLVAGFVVSGRVPRRLLIRGIGPALAAFGVTGALADPRLDLFAKDGTLLASNDDWDGASTAADVMTAGAQAGAFELARSSKDAALVINLAPGSYTVHVTGKGTASGDALVEIYEVP